MTDENYLTYDQWIEEIFNHPVSEPAWYFAEANESYALWDLYRNHPQITLEYITRTFEESAKLPLLFSDGQIADGLNYIVNPSCSDIFSTVVNVKESVRFEAQLRCIEAIYTVYEQLFSVRCSIQLSASKRDQTNRNLNILCFMWWDMLPVYGGTDQIIAEKMNSAMLDVIVRISKLKSEACQKAALHGLSEWYFIYPQKVSALVKEFLVRHPQISPELKNYAEKASWGELP
jgi:hypothetical protein